MLLNDWPSFFNICIAIFVFVFTLGIAWYTGRHRNLPGATLLFILAISGSVWAVIYSLELLSLSQNAKIFWENLQFLVLSVIPVLYFVFIMVYTGRGRIFESRIWLLFLVEPLFSQIIIWTDSYHHWFRTSALISYSSSNYPGTLINNYGTWFWINTVYILLFFFINLIVLAVSCFQSPRWARKKLWFLLLAASIPWFATIVSLPLWVANNHDYLILLSIAVSLLIMAWGIFRTRILDILPIAREALLDQINDAVVVLDFSGRIVDLNQAAKRYPQVNPVTWIGKQFSSILPEFEAIDFVKDKVNYKEQEVTLHANGKIRTFELRISPLQSETLTLAGWLVVFHDVTAHKIEEEKLRKAENEALNAYTDAQQHQKELVIIRKITETLNQATTLRHALIPAMDSMLTISKGKAIWLLLLEKDNAKHRTIHYSPGNERSPLNFLDDIPNNDPCLQALLNRELTKPMEFSHCTCNLADQSSEKVKNSHLSFPLHSGTDLIGLINLSLDPAYPLSEDSLNLISTLCDSLSVAIERVRLFKEEHNQRHIAEALQQISSTLTASLDLDEVLDLLLEQIARLVPHDAGNIMLLDDEKAWISRAKGYDYLDSEIKSSLFTLTFPISTTLNISRIVATKQPLVINDTYLEPEWIQNEISRPFHSWVGAPVILNEKVVAIFSLDKKEPAYFTHTHAERLASFCSSAALAIQNARLYEAGLKRIKELESLQAIMQDITSELDLKQLLNDITVCSISLLGSTSGILGLFDKETQTLEIVVGISPKSKFTGEMVSLGEGVMGRVAQTHKPIVVHDYSTWPGHLDRFVQAFPHSVLEVPLLAGDELLGVIGVGDSNPQREFGEEDIRLLSLFAQQATIGIRNARLFADAKRQAEEAETLRQASAIVASTLDQKESLRLILNQLAQVIPFDSASVLLERDGELEIVEGKGFKEDTPLIGMHVPINSDQPGAQVFIQKKSMIVRNMPKEYPAFNVFNKLPIQSWIGVPLIYGERTIGILALDSLETDRYTEDHARLAKAFAYHVAIALENVRLYESAIQSAKRLGALYKLSQKISANLRPEEVYRAIHKATKDLMASDSFILSLYDETNQMINDVYFVDHGIPQKPNSRPIGQGLFSRVITEKKTLFYNHFNDKMVKRTNAILIGDEKDDSIVQSLIIVPLRLGKNIRGIISTQSYNANAYSEEDKETLELLAAHAVIALENAQLFSEVQELAITDSLTKIFNRRRFFELADQEFERSRRYSRPLSFIMMDIDHFKRVNDSLGHAAGDQALEKLAELCQNALREVDIFARYGGEEFVIMLPETTSGEAQLTAERIRQLIARTPIEINSHSLNITLSFGVVELYPTCRNTEELLDRSDQALYRSKRTGRNRVTIWNPTMQPKGESTPQP